MGFRWRTMAFCSLVTVNCLQSFEALRGHELLLVSLEVQMHRGRDTHAAFSAVSSMSVQYTCVLLFVKLRINTHTHTHIYQRTW